MVINVEGQHQLVYQSEDAIIGLDPGDGSRLWSHPSVNVNRDNISPPIWGADGLLWTAMQPEGGATACEAHDARRAHGACKVLHHVPHD